MKNSLLQPTNESHLTKEEDKRRQRTKTLILARHGMLECGANRKETMSEKCRNCDVVDNETHRLNECTNFNHMNLAHNSEKCTFSDIYSGNELALDKVITNIERVWEFRHANGKVRKL